jgi:hypothetical protein
MTTLAERLFDTQGGVALTSETLDEGNSILVLALEAVTAVMEGEDDEVHTLQECATGYLASGSQTAIHLSHNGQISKRAIQERDRNIMHNPQDILNELSELSEAKYNSLKNKKKKPPTGTGPYAGAPASSASPLAALGRLESVEEQAAGVKAYKNKKTGKTVWVKPNQAPPTGADWGLIIGKEESVNEAKRDLAGEAMGLSRLLRSQAGAMAKKVKGSPQEAQATPQLAGLMLGAQALSNLANKGDANLIGRALSGKKSNDDNLDMGHLMATAAQAGVISPADAQKYSAVRAIVREGMEVSGDDIEEGYTYAKGRGKGYGSTSKSNAPYGKSKSRGFSGTDPRPEDENLQVRESDALQFWLDDLVEDHYTPDMLPFLREIDEAVEAEDFAAFDEAALVVAEMAGLLQEYKRQSNAQRAKAARTRKKPKTSKQKKAAKARRKNYKKNRAANKRKAALYRKKTKNKVRESLELSNLMDYDISEARKRIPRFLGLQKAAMRFLPKQVESMDEQRDTPTDPRKDAGYPGKFDDYPGLDGGDGSWRPGGDNYGPFDPRNPRDPHLPEEPGDPYRVPDDMPWIDYGTGWDFSFNKGGKGGNAPKAPRNESLDEQWGYYVGGGVSQGGGRAGFDATPAADVDIAPDSQTGDPFVDPGTDSWTAADLEAGLTLGDFRAGLTLDGDHGGEEGGLGWTAEWNPSGGLGLGVHQTPFDDNPSATIGWSWSF